MDADQGEYQRSKVHPFHGEADQPRVVGEHPGHDFRGKLPGEESRRRDQPAGDDAVLQGLLDPLKLLRPVVVSHNGLHALRKPHDQHHEQDEYPVEDAERAYGHVAAVLLEADVDEHRHETGAYVQQKR